MTLSTQDKIAAVVYETQDVTFNPSECLFGIHDDPDDECKMVFISVMDGNNAFDGMYSDLLAKKPDWLPEYVEMECHWAIPNDMTIDEVKKSLVDLGYTYKPEWNGP